MSHYVIAGCSQYKWMYIPLDCHDEESDCWVPAREQGEDTSVLRITAVTEAHQGKYRCVVSNTDPLNVAESDVATLFVGEVYQSVNELL